MWGFGQCSVLAEPGRRRDSEGKIGEFTVIYFSVFFNSFSFSTLALNLTFCSFVTFDFVKSLVKNPLFDGSSTNENNCKFKRISQYTEFKEKTFSAIANIFACKFYLNIGRDRSETFGYFMQRRSSFRISVSHERPHVSPYKYMTIRNNVVSARQFQFQNGLYPDFICSSCFG